MDVRELIQRLMEYDMSDNVLIMANGDVKSIETVTQSIDDYGRKCIAIKLEEEW